jgi:predicted metalloendopeptidase
VSLVSGYLGDALGRLYVERHFPPTARDRARRLVGTMLEAYRRAIKQLDWMSAPTRREALDKLKHLEVRIGYPDRWRDYGGLVIRSDDLLGNIERAKRFENGVRMARLAQPASHDEWLISPQTANASYNPAMNEIVLPAAILQPPLFDAFAEDAVNYGAIGAVIGHEIGHGFDARGRRFDGSGSPRDWWRPQDEREFEKRARALVEQFGAISPLEGTRVDGELTLAENLGDLGGLEVALQAYRISLGGRPSPVIDGFTGEQRFFISWARTWRGKLREDYLRQWVLSMPHAPPQYRANGPASNLSGFYEAFGVKPGDRMYREPGRRVTIW